MKKYYLFIIAVCISTAMQGQVINFTDSNFKAKLLSANLNNAIAVDSEGSSMKIDANNNGEIEVSEAIDVYGLSLLQSYISDMSGIEYFTNLTRLGFAMNYVTQINVSSLTNLSFLDCSNNNLISLNLNGLVNLKELYCGNEGFMNFNLSGVLLKKLGFSGSMATMDLSSQTALENLEFSFCENLTSINLSGLINLINVYCEYNPLLTALDFSGATLLTDLNLNNNSLNSLNLEGCSSLYYLMIDSNKFTTLDLSDCSSLGLLYCSANLLQSIDVSNSPLLTQLWCNFNPNLETILMKNSSIIPVSYEFQISNTPNLKYICADDDEIEAVEFVLDMYQNTTCIVNSYCSFVPGGEFYTITGTAKVDTSNDGCDALDVNKPFLKFALSNGTQTGTVISDDSGNFNIPVQAGSHVITPVLENPTYFSLSLTTTTVSFPTSTSPFIQDFCIAPNGSHPDIEAVIFPLDIVRPGFDTKYKILYRNKGNTSLSGTLYFSYQEDKIDFVSSSVTPGLITEGALAYIYTDLQPFQTSSIIVTLNINAPTDVPPVNSGDIITVNIHAPLVSDVMQPDNFFSLSQTAVNSFDPNDKTCLEGSVIAPEMIGKYVHYMIRFENTGTANAQNIVVKDMIDTSKFDISSLIPLDGSHAFTTRITNTNQVEFVFENIQLPFDNANNDGYVAFKIKTKPTLVAGDSFSNSAGIYFDYNFPIITDPAVTIVQGLNVDDKEFSKKFNISPNPANDFVNINSISGAQIKSVSIYNALGQLVRVVLNSDKINVSELPTGNYFIKIDSDKGISNTRFIKK